MLIKLKDSIKNFIYQIVPPPYTNESYSQAGEDCCIGFLFDQLKITSPTYLELGVCHPKIGSNTYRFYKNGGTGVLVEADPSLIETIKQFRIKDIILNVAVATEENGVADFYIFDERSHNTLSKSEAELRTKNGTGKIVRIQKIPITTINKILKENFKSVPHFLSIDIEGLDLIVLQSLDFNQFPIPVICAETCSFSENHIKPKTYAIQEFLHSKGYFTYADTYLNTIFVNEKWFTTYNIRK